jgi:hypothetical protein
VATQTWKATAVCACSQSWGRYPANTTKQSKCIYGTTYLPASWKKDSMKFGIVNLQQPCWANSIFNHNGPTQPLL